MMLDHFPILFRHILVWSADQTHLKACINFLVSKTGQTLNSLLPSYRVRVLVELITMFQFSKKRIIQGLGMCAQADYTFKHEEKKKGEKVPQTVLAVYVSKGLQAVLASFVSSLSNPASTSQHKLQCLQSLRELMTFLQFDQMKSSKYALLDCAKLATALSRTESKFEEAALALWTTFVKTFDLPALVSILPQVLTGVLPHLESSPQPALKIFSYLLRDNIHLSPEQLSQLEFLPSHSQLEPLLGREGGRDLKSVLLSLLGCLESESVAVRLQTVRSLSVFLELNIGGVQGLMVCSDRTDPLVTRLVNSLMAALSSREPDSEVRYRAGLCLGQLGPVDPGKLDFVVNLAGVREEAASRRTVLDVFSVGFCVQLLQELVRGQASAREPVIAENCSYSLQEVLRIYNIDLRTDKNSFSQRVWSRLSAPTREKLLPLFQSQYKHLPGPRPHLPSPLYLSPQARTFRDWLVNWVSSLLPLISDQRKRNLFQVCLPALKKDLTIGELVLPRLVMCVLCECETENNEALITELTAVIESAGRTEDRTVLQCVARSLFLIQDHLTVWRNTKFSSLLAATNKSPHSLQAREIQDAVNEDKEYLNVAMFVERIPQQQLANFSYEVSAFHRAVFHFELYLKAREQWQSDKSCLEQLQKLYIGLEDPDLVRGVAALRDQASPGGDRGLHEATGNYTDALSCLQLLGTDGAGLVSQFLNLDQPTLASALAAQLRRDQPQVAPDLLSLQVEAAWQLGQWDNLAESLENNLPDNLQDNLQDNLPDNLKETAGNYRTGWQLGLGGILLAVKREDWTNMRSRLDQLRQDVVESITSTSLEQGAYQRRYQQVNQLGMLYEVQLISEKFLLSSPKELARPDSDWSPLLSELSTRLTYAQSSWTILEPVLRLRRCCLALAEDRVRPHNPGLADRLHHELGETWLQSAQLARKTGLVQESFRFLMEAQNFTNVKTFKEMAELSWARNKKTEAISILQRGLLENFSRVEEALKEDSSNRFPKETLGETLASLNTTEKEVLCRGKLLLARYQEDAASVSIEDVGKIYTQARTIAPNDEEVFYLFARSIDEQQLRYLGDEQMLQHGKLVHCTCAYYIKSMMNGPTYLHHCMPRLLSIWLDYAELVEAWRVDPRQKDRMERAQLSDNVNMLDKLVSSMEKGLGEIPLYYLVTALPQIVSIMCLTHEGSYRVMKEVMISLLTSQYSRQTFWQMVSVSKNRNKKRSARCQAIFLEAAKKNSQVEKILKFGLDFAYEIDKLCDLVVPAGGGELSIQERLPSLTNLVKSREFSDTVILPNQANMLVTLPTADANVSTHNPFPSGLVTIQAIENQVTVLPSMVKPRRIAVLGSDGKRYQFLAKPKDDLRRDSRLVDCIGLLNRLFRKDDEASRRNLHIRTYAVVSTNETSGLIEWVNSLQPIRLIIRYLQRKQGNNFDPNFFEEYRSHETQSVEEKRKNLVRCMKAQGGPVFSRWFIENFSDPQSWLMARTSYVRSTAVNSMMGYIIGLGDRHLENINVDTTTGETFHVDFNCLFNKGEGFKIPETVPFRLTHNMVLNEHFILYFLHS